MANELIFEGLPELEEKFKQLEAVAQRQTLTRAAKAGAEPIRAAASSAAPRRSGTLASSIIISAPSGEQTTDESSVRIGPSKQAWYGRLVERGTQFAAPRPFLDPAFEANQDQAIDRAREVLEEEINKI